MDLDPEKAPAKGSGVADTHVKVKLLRAALLPDRRPQHQDWTLLSAGYSYQHATADFVNSFAPLLRAQVISVYVDSLRLVWQISILISCTSFLLVFFEKQIKLRTELDTEYGVEEKRKKQAPSATR
ncbi:hypothetical protein EPUS_05647 [Endocarpon pusillum Z07020]|uniref:Uncharacterized protein n=1 Tax=Endocarpon pusillum (strain Z07020 / HMAS-L-300199) TaxID=1263415 RepID=U1G948_ENDPU|nr:uncharacterized protein EPUS_05647 [Endocarpon pusillum Z07020]ERF68508.1 hypothetical protein EPUS_05647 [Endocarpon pusillum Z07020]